MKLTVLGSGCLLPVPGRGNSGYLLQTENHHILIDGGSGTLRRMADFGLNYRHIDYIVYTHLHPDHTLDLVPLLFALKYNPEIQLPGKLTIIAPFEFQTYFNRLMDIFGHWVIPEDLEIVIHEVLKDRITLSDVQILSGPTEHTDQSVTYRFSSGSGRDLFYSGDTDICKDLISNAKDVSVLLLECSFPDNLKRKGHLTPSECGKIAAETRSEHLLLTHFYPEVLNTDILSSVKQHFQGKVDLAYDGMEVLI